MSEINELQEKSCSGTKKVKQLQCEILFLKHRSLPSEPTERELIFKKKQLKTALKTAKSNSKANAIKGTLMQIFENLPISLSAYKKIMLKISL